MNQMSRQWSKKAQAGWVGAIIKNTGFLMVVTMPDIPSSGYRYFKVGLLYPALVDYLGSKKLICQGSSNMAVTWCLSSLFVIGMTYSAAWCMIHCHVNTRWSAVWFQLKIRSGSTSFITTYISLDISKKVFLSLLDVGERNFYCIRTLPFDVAQPS